MTANGTVQQIHSVGTLNSLDTNLLLYPDSIPSHHQPKSQCHQDILALYKNISYVTLDFERTNE